ncbi:MAG TPA: C40 family peptidase [Pyrinomonadaceae bacterium]|nr:C40 family peptidase [Pyrinomonadaceae bacterium]
MSFCRLFPRPLAVTFALTLLALSAQAQTATRPRQATPTQTTTTTEAEGRSRLENDIFVVEESDSEEGAEPAPAKPQFGVPTARLGFFERSILTAIEERLGTPYRMGTEGPYRYDCSGFVWSVFQQAGVPFERSSARSLWNTFAPPTEDEKYKFGTLVFFNHLNHVGIVADANGFYHASTSRGVVYSRFDDYWTKRLVGFRRVPATTLVASAGR